MSLLRCTTGGWAAACQAGASAWTALVEGPAPGGGPKATSDPVAASGVPALAVADM